MGFVWPWWASYRLITMHAWVSSKMGVVASLNFNPSMIFPTTMLLEPLKQVRYIQLSQIWVLVAVVICFPNWSTCHQRKIHFPFRCRSPRIPIFCPILITTATKPRHLFSSDPAKSQSHMNYSFEMTKNPFDNSPMLFFWMREKPCNSAHYNYNIRSVPWTRWNKQPTTSLYGEFSMTFFSCCDCGPESLESRFLVIKGVETPHNLSLKNAQAHREHIETGNRQSSAVFALIHDYF